MVKIAIIGASKHRWKEPKKAKTEVKRAVISTPAPELIFPEEDAFLVVLSEEPTAILVSDAGEVEFWAEEIADELKLKKQIFKPRKQNDITCGEK